MEIVKIGRDISNDYVINHPEVSGFHADLYVYDAGNIHYIDHSTNGSYVNNQSVHKANINVSRNDYITFPGQIVIKVSDILENIESGNDGSDKYDGYMKINPGMKFGETFVHYFNNYANFTGRARRKEYLFIVLWNLIFSIIPIVNVIWYIATIVPSLALSVRRLHDVGKSGWWMLLSLIPIVGSIVILVWLLTDSDMNENEYGKSPKYQ